MSSSIRNSNLFSAEDYKKVFKSYQFIDYTAYDFDTLKQALINYIQTYYPEDFNDYIEAIKKRLHYVTILDIKNYDNTTFIIEFKDEYDSVFYIKVLDESIILTDTK